VIEKTTKGRIMDKERIVELDRLIANVPDLVRTAFQEGFIGNGSGALGEAWDRSKAKAALDGAASPLPASWSREKDQIALLAAKLEAANARCESLDRLRANVAELTDEEVDAYLWDRHPAPTTEAPER
jgi:hypothetical protein